MAKNSKHISTLFEAINFKSRRRKSPLPPAKPPACSMHCPTQPSGPNLPTYSDFQQSDFNLKQFIAHIIPSYLSACSASFAQYILSSLSAILETSEEEGFPPVISKALHLLPTSQAWTSNRGGPPGHVIFSKCRPLK